MAKTTQAQILDEIRHIVGLHPDGTRNGNGLLGTVNNMKKEINDIKKEMDSINKNIISINNKLEKHTEKIEAIACDIKEIKESLNDKIGMNSISNLHTLCPCGVKYLFALVLWVVWLVL